MTTFIELYTEEILAGGALVFVLLLLVLVFYYKRSRSASHKITVALRPYAQDQIKDIIIPDGVGGVLEIEHLVLLEQGLLLIKTYPFSGNLFAAEKIDQWTQVVDGKSFKFVNPLNHIYSTRLALKTLASNIPIFCRIIFTADSVFPKGKPDEASTLSSLSDDLQIINNSPKIAEKVQQSWQSIVQIARENGQAIKHKGDEYVD